MGDAMDEVREEHWMILLFRDQLSVAIVPKSVVPPFRVGTTTYRSPEDDYLPAFYDRLLDSRETLVGIRVHPVSTAAKELLRGLSSRDYLRLGDGYVDILLAKDMTGELIDAGDQAFGGQVFKDESGSVGISLDLNYFCTAHSALASIRASDALWVTIEEAA